MTKITERKLRNSVLVAQHLAQCEIRLEWFLSRAKESETGMLKREQILNHEAREYVERDPVAAELMPQARERVRMAETRRKALEGTTLGKLKEVVLSYHVNGQVKPTPFDNFQMDAKWEAFIAKAVTGPAGMCAELNAMLSMAIHDLVIEDLPPVPPPYKYGGLTMPF